jgi:hypothetical protein
MMDAADRRDCGARLILSVGNMSCDGRVLPPVVMDGPAPLIASSSFDIELLGPDPQRIASLVQSAAFGMTQFRETLNAIRKSNIGCERALMFAGEFVLSKLDVKLGRNERNYQFARIGLRRTVPLFVGRTLALEKYQERDAEAGAGRRISRTEMCRLNDFLAGENRRLLYCIQQQNASNAETQRSLVECLQKAQGQRAQLIEDQRRLSETHVSLYKGAGLPRRFRGFQNLFSMTQCLSNYIEKVIGTNPGAVDDPRFFAGFRWAAGMQSIFQLVCRSKEVKNAMQKLLGGPCRRTLKRWSDQIIARNQYTEKPYELCQANVRAAIHLFAPHWPRGTKVLMGIDATSLAHDFSCKLGQAGQGPEDLSTVPLTEEEAEAVLQGGVGYLKVATERDLADAAHVVTLMAPELPGFVPLCVIPAVSGARTERVNAELRRCQGLVELEGFQVDGIVTDGDLNGVKNDLTIPCDQVMLGMDELTEDSEMVIAVPVSRSMGLARMELGRWVRNFDFFHLLNNARSAYAQGDLLLIYPPRRAVDPLESRPRCKRKWRLEAPTKGTMISKVKLTVKGLSPVFNERGPYDGMNQAKTLEMFGSYNFKLVLQAWKDRKLDGSHVVMWTLPYLLVSVRTQNLGRAESVWRWTWAYAIATALAYAWKRTAKTLGGNYRGNPLFGRDLLNKMIHFSALHTLDALENKQMNLEAYDTRRLEHFFGGMKLVAPDECLAS